MAVTLTDRMNALILQSYTVYGDMHGRSGCDLTFRYSGVPAHTDKRPMPCWDTTGDVKSSSLSLQVMITTVLSLPTCAREPGWF